MPSPFSRTQAALGADGIGRSVAGLSAALLIASGWIAWFTLAHVALYEATESARIEAAGAAHAVQAPVDGRLVAANLVIGRRVAAGDELARVESDAQQLLLREQETHAAALAAQIDAVRRETTLTERTGSDERRAALAAIDVTRSQIDEAEAPAAFAEEQAKRFARLRTDGLVADADAALRRSEAAQRRAAADGLRLNIVRLQREQDTRDRDRDAKLQRLRGEATRLDGDLATARAAIDRLRFEADRRVIRAAVSGELGEVAVLRPGAFVKEGETLAAIVPADGMRVVAEFAPSAALGRIRHGQPARLRLQGFPWMQYGSLTASVERVATEVRNGTVRVELALDPSAASAIPVQHGLPGSLEVEVERITPAALALRLAGRIATAPRRDVTAAPQIGLTEAAGRDR